MEAELQLARDGREQSDWGRVPGPNLPSWGIDGVLHSAFWGQAKMQLLGEGAAPPERGLCVQSSSLKPWESDLFPRGVSHPCAHRCLTHPYGQPDGRANKICNRGEIEGGQAAGLKVKASCSPRSGQHGKGLLHPLPVPPAPLLPTGAACAPCQEHPSVPHHQDSGCTLSKMPGKRVLAGTALMPVASPGPIPREP